jgi:hypothetical protein
MALEDARRSSRPVGLLAGGICQKECSMEIGRPGMEPRRGNPYGRYAAGAMRPFTAVVIVALMVLIVGAFLIWVLPGLT